MSTDRIVFVGTNEAHLALMLPILRRLGPARCDVLPSVSPDKVLLDPLLSKLAAEGFAFADCRRRYELVVTDAASWVWWEGNLRPAVDLRALADRTLCLTHTTSIAPDLAVPCMDGFLAPHAASAESGIQWMVGRDPRYIRLADDERAERRAVLTENGARGPLIVWALPASPLSSEWIEVVEQAAQQVALVVKIHPHGEQTGGVLSPAVRRTSFDLGLLVQLADLVLVHPGAATVVEQCVWFGVPWLAVATAQMGTVSDRVAFAAQRLPALEPRQVLAELTGRVALAPSEGARASAAFYRRAFYEREVAVGGPFHVDSTQVRRGGKAARASLVRRAGLHGDGSLPIVVWFEYNECRLAEVADALGQLARTYYVIVKTRATPREEALRILPSGVGLWDATELVPNELRASADFVVAHPHSSTYVSSMLMGCRVVALHGARTDGDVREAWSAFGLVDALGGAVSTAYPVALRSRLENARYWEWYDTNMPMIRSRCMGETRSDVALDCTVQLIDTFAETGTFGGENVFPRRFWQY